MAKASITKKYALSGHGILEINDDGVFLENQDTGELIDLKDLLVDFKDKDVKLSVTYDYDYE
jgi:hypothetical protein